MDYKEMILNARAAGVANEKAMWTGIEQVNELLKVVKAEHPDMYEKFMRTAHEALYGPHYNDCFAEMDISKLSYTDNKGLEHKGAHWTRADIMSVTAGKSFPSGTTDADKWVAYNAAYADFCKAFDEAQILEIAYLFYFADEDWKGKGKVWTYMHSNK